MRYFKLNMALPVQILHLTRAQGQIPHPQEGLEPQISYSPGMEKSQLSRGMPGWGGGGGAGDVEVQIEIISPPAQRHNSVSVH